MKVSEPAVAYNTSYLQVLKNRIIASLDSTTDEEKLQRCLELLSDEEIRLSEASGYITQEEALAKFAKWGFER